MTFTVLCDHMNKVKSTEDIYLGSSGSTNDKSGVEEQVVIATNYNGVSAFK